MRATRRTPPHWWVLGPTVAALVAVLAILATRWGAILVSQPGDLLTLLVVGAVSVVGITRSLVDVGPNDSDTHNRPRRRVIAARVLGVAGVVGLVLALVWLRPLPATAVAEATMSGTPVVRVADATSRIDLTPTGYRAGTGLFSYTGALVDPRAYVPLLTSLVAHGYPVVVVKPPYGNAFLATDAPSGVIADHRSVTRWVFGGHSLGGVVATSYAGAGHARADGPLLWASYPNGSIASATSLLVTSVAAGNDGLAALAKIEASRPDLPPDTRYVTVAGAVHADFGDFGSQRRDGTPTVSRAEAQRQIEAASLDLLQRVDGRTGS